MGRGMVEVRGWCVGRDGGEGLVCGEGHGGGDNIHMHLRYIHTYPPQSYNVRIPVVCPHTTVCSLISNTWIHIHYTRTYVHTFLLVLQKMTACVMVSVSYRSHRVSNFHSSFSTATKNCLIPSRVNSSLRGGQ